MRDTISSDQKWSVVRRAIKDWPSTARLCVVLIVLSAPAETALAITLLR